MNKHLKRDALDGGLEVLYVRARGDSILFIGHMKTFTLRCMQKFLSLETIFLRHSKVFSSQFFVHTQKEDCYWKEYFSVNHPLLKSFQKYFAAAVASDYYLNDILISIQLCAMT